MAVKKRRSDFPAACLFLAPNFLGFLVFVVFPVIFSIAMAFTNWDLSLHNRFRDEPLQWVWLRNFGDLLTHPEFWKYFGNTFFLMMSIPVGIVGSLILAILLTRKLRSDSALGRWGLAALSLIAFTAVGLLFSGSGYGVIALVFCILAGAILALGFTAGPTVYRTLFFLPSFTAGVAVYLLWMYQRVFFGEVVHEVNKKLTDLTFTEKAILTLLLIFIVWIGVHPTTFLSVSENSVGMVLTRLGI